MKKQILKSRKLILLCLLSLGLLAQANTGTAGFASSVPKQATSPDLLFIENKGQWDAGINYRAKISPGQIDLKADRFHFVFIKEDMHEYGHPPENAAKTISGHVFDLLFLNSNPNVTFERSDDSPTYLNYFIGNDASKWASYVQQFKKVRYKNLYTGIDMDVRGEQDQFIYDYVVHAGADVSQISSKYDGVSDLKIKNGSIYFSTTAVEVQELKPFSYQLINNEKVSVPCNFVLEKDGSIHYEFPRDYNHGYDLVIDPTLTFSSYTGSTADNFGFCATYDQAGNLYAGGIVFDGGAYPTVGAFSSSFNGGYFDIAISKFNATGSALLFSTYLGGSEWDRPHSLVVSNNNELFLYGSTSSPNYPTTSGAYDRTFNGGYDIVISRFSPTGASLTSSTYVGGTSDDGMHQPTFEYRGFDLAKNYSDECRGEIYLDSFNNVYIASYTMSSNFPTTAAAVQPSFQGVMDACVFKMPADLSVLRFSTFLGGSSYDAAYSLKLDLSNSIIVCGGTMSSDMPVGGYSYDPSANGGIDGFIYKLTNNGSAIMARTYVGTGAYDQNYFVDIDRYNNIYVMGQTEGSMPIIGSVYSNTNGKQYVQKYNNDLSALLISTVFGSGRSTIDISPTAFLVDRCDNIYVSGWGGNVNSTSFGYAGGSTTGMAVTGDAYKSTTDGSDFYFIVFNRNASSLLYASYFGGNASVGEHVDGGTCRFDKDGVIYEAVCAGCGGNSLFPATAGAWSTTNRSSNCNLAAMKFEFNLAGTNVAVNASPRAAGCVPLTVNFTSVLTRVRTVRWYFGDGGTSTVANPTHVYTDTGTFNVMLIGTDSTSCNITDTAYLTVFVDDDSITANFIPNLVESCSTRTVSAYVVDFPTTTYAWNFGDGGTSTNDTVVHTYATPGTYTISLRVDDPTSCNLIQTVTRTITIKPLVDLNFALSDTSGCFPLSITFNNSTSSTGAFLWDFDDGITSTLKSPTHTFTAGGTYHVQLTLNDSSTCNIVDTAFVTVDVFYDTVAPHFQIDRTFYGCDSVGIRVESFNTDATSIAWFFGDGDSSHAFVANHMYRDSGIYYIDYMVYDSTKYCRPRDTIREYVSLNPINTQMGFSDTNGCVPLDIIFTDESGYFLATSYWNFGDGTSDTGLIVSHNYSSVNTWIIQHIIIDSSVCTYADTAYETIYTRNDSTVASFSSVILNQCDSNMVVAFTNSSINATQYYWDFGDGTNSTIASPTHTWTLPGLYTVMMISIDTNRCHPRDTAYNTYLMKPNAIARFDMLSIACAGVPVAFDNQSNPSATFTWLFSDGGIATAYEPSHVFDSAGTYTITLVIRDTGTCDMFDTMRKSITILAFPVASFIMDRDSFYYLDQIQFTNQSNHYTDVIWHFGNGDTSIVENPLYQYPQIHEQHPCIIAYIAGTGCADTFCQEIFINYDAIIGVPNAFSPNGDGVNDVVKVEGLGIVELEFLIFNRWGQKIFQSNDKAVGWDGTYKGVAQEMDVYAYTVKAKFLDNTRKNLSGNITLLR